MKKLIMVALLAIGTNMAVAQNDAVHQKADKAAKMEEMIERLELTQDQQIAWKEINEKYRPKMKALRQNESLAKEDKRASLKQLKKEQQHEITQLLNEKQKEEYKKMLAERRSKMKARRGERMKPTDVK